VINKNENKYLKKSSAHPKRFTFPLFFLVKVFTTFFTYNIIFSRAAVTIIHSATTTVSSGFAGVYETTGIIYIAYID
jgi:hypothetical protein